MLRLTCTNPGFVPLVESPLIACDGASNHWEFPVSVFGRVAKVFSGKRRHERSPKRCSTNDGLRRRVGWWKISRFSIWLSVKVFAGRRRQKYSRKRIPTMTSARFCRFQGGFLFGLCAACWCGGEVTLA